MKPSRWIERMRLKVRDPAHWEVLRVLGLQEYVRGEVYKLDPVQLWMAYPEVLMEMQLRAVLRVRHTRHRIGLEGQKGR